MNKNMRNKIVAILLVICLLTSLVTISFNIQTMALAPSVFEEDPVPVNPNANQTCKNFYQYLCNLRKSRQVISGATSNKLIGSDTEIASAEADYHQMIKDKFGVTPVILGTSKYYHDGYTKKDVEVLADRYSSGSIPMFSLWADKGNVKDGIINLDATNPNRDPEEYNRYQRILERLGDFCLELEDSGVEVYLIRMFLENNNTGHGGFYGDSEEGYAAFKKVWQQTVDYLINERGVTGALFVYCPAGMFSKPSIDYYPGEKYVDINGPTVYSNSADGEIHVEKCATDYEWMKTINRPFAMTELGARNVMSYTGIYPIGDYKETIDSILYAFPETTMVVLWYNDSLSIEPAGNSSSLGNYHGDMFIYHPSMIVAENAINYRSSKKIDSTGIATFFTDSDASKKAISLNTGKYSSTDLKSKGINIGELASLDVVAGYGVALYNSKDCSGEANAYFGKTTNLSEVMKKANSLSVFRLDNLSLEKDIFADNDDTMVYKLNDGDLGRFVTQSSSEDDSFEATVDLGDTFTVGQISIDHAGFYEDYTYNIRDFAIYASNDDNNYQMIYKMVGNTAPQTNICFESVTARYIRLKVLKANSSKSIYERNRISLAEFSVYGTKDIAMSNKDDATDSFGYMSTEGYAEGENVISTDDSDALNDNSDVANKKANNEKGHIPQIIIPDFYNYVWLIICGGIVLLTGSGWSIIYLCYRHKKNKSKRTPND